MGKGCKLQRLLTHGVRVRSLAGEVGLARFLEIKKRTRSKSIFVMKLTAPPKNSLSVWGARLQRLRRDLALALLPTLTVLIVLAGLELLVKQRLLFASLASSAFAIYLAPHHKSNRVRTLFGAQFGAALAGFGAQKLLGPGYSAAAGAMLLVIAVMVALDAVHPPAASSALSFAFVPVAPKSVAFFALAVGLVGLLVSLQKWIDAKWLRFDRERSKENL